MATGMKNAFVKLERTGQRGGKGKRGRCRMTSGAIDDENAGIQFRRNRQSDGRNRQDTRRRNEHTTDAESDSAKKKKKRPRGWLGRRRVIERQAISF